MARILPLLCLSLYGAIAFGWRAWLHSRRYGHSGLVLFQSGRWMQHLREGLLLLLNGILLVQALLIAVDPAALERIALVRVPVTGGWLALGTCMTVAGLVLTVAAQLTMGASWRVGVDEGARPGLVTEGLYGFSRNPIYLAMFLSLAGFVVLVPTWLTLVVLFAAIAGIHHQVRDEERYLQRSYGEGYLTYARRVGRFVPRLGTLE